MDVQHADLTSIHPFAVLSATDPGSIGDHKGWIDTSVTPHLLKVRNTGNTAWEAIGIATLNLDNLGDVVAPTPTDRSRLAWSAANSRWEDEAPLEVLEYALSDEITDITTGTNVLRARVPYPFEVVDVRTSLSDASSSGVVTVDINVAGSTILSTKVSIDATEKTSVSAAVPAVLSTTSLADDVEIAFDIDAAGTDAKGLKVKIRGYRTV